MPKYKELTYLIPTRQLFKLISGIIKARIKDKGKQANNTALIFKTLKLKLSLNQVNYTIPLYQRKHNRYLWSKFRENTKCLAGLNGQILINSIQN